MEELRIKAGGMEFNVTGEPETVKGASKDFYDFLAAKDQREIVAKKEIAEKMREKMAWYAVKSLAAERSEPQSATEAGSATLRAVRTSATSWEQIAREIKNGDGLAVGDKVDFTLKSGE